MVNSPVASVLTSVCRVIYDNINAGQSRQERFKRAIKCLVVFAAVFLFFNSYIIRGRFKIWEENPAGASIWLFLSLMLSLWMAMWTSQCTVLMDETSDDIYSDHHFHYRRNLRNLVVPLSQEIVELESMKQQALINCPIISYREVINLSNGRIISNDDNICCVCLINFAHETQVRQTQCQHIFCSDCFETLVDVCRNMSSLICPMCRHPLSSQTLNHSDIITNDGNDEEEQMPIIMNNENQQLNTPTLQEISSSTIARVESLGSMDIEAQDPTT